MKWLEYHFFHLFLSQNISISYRLPDVIISVVASEVMPTTSHIPDRNDPPLYKLPQSKELDILFSDGEHCHLVFW